MAAGGWRPERHAARLQLGRTASATGVDSRQPWRGIFAHVDGD